MGDAYEPEYAEAEDTRATFKHFEDKTTSIMTSRYTQMPKSV